MDRWSFISEFLQGEDLSKNSCDFFALSLARGSVISSDPSLFTQVHPSSRCDTGHHAPSIQVHAYSLFCDTKNIA